MKKKIFVICLCIILIAITMVFGSLAYFTDSDYSDVQSVVVGNVKLELLDTGRDIETLHHGEVIVPGSSFEKTLTVANVGSCDAYVRLHIDIAEDTNRLFAFQLSDDVAIADGADATGAMIAPVNSVADPAFAYSTGSFEEGGVTYIRHTFTCKEILLKNTESKTPVVSMKLRNELDNKDFENMGDLTVLFRMEGIQTSSEFANVTDAFLAFEAEVNK